jgi:hypothetical protein
VRHQMVRETCRLVTRKIGRGVLLIAPTRRVWNMETDYGLTSRHRLFGALVLKSRLYTVHQSWRTCGWRDDSAMESVYSGIATGVTLRTYWAEFSSRQARTACHESVTAPEEIQHLLHRQDDNVTHQVVILALPKELIPWDATFDVLGFGLDMTLPVWEYMEGQASWPHWPLPWIKDCPVLKMGDHFFSILDSVPNGRPNTGELGRISLLSL